MMRAIHSVWYDYKHDYLLIRYAGDYIDHFYYRCGEETKFVGECFSDDFKNMMFIGRV